MTKVTKRDCSEVDFDKSKIKNAIMKAMKYGSGRVDENLAGSISASIESKYIDEHEVSIYEIEKDVFNMLCECMHEDTARAYEGYRSIQTYKREHVNTTDDAILSLINGMNSELATENSNKDIRINSTQRDYIAGEVSKDLTRRYKLPTRIVQAHDDGVLHFHDADYFLQPENNCGLVDIKDMFDNGTVINGRAIRKPKSFKVACTVLTQIIAQVASNQYGGTSVAIKHLGEYLKISEDKYRAMLKDTIANKEEFENTVQILLSKELEDGIQTIQYQILTLMTTNGQTPFVTLFLELDKKDKYLPYTARVIYELLKQRLDGIPNENGIKSTPTFPKLIYVLDDFNCFEGGEYDWVTDMAVQCSAVRMYPDYISAKEMRKIYEGNVFSSMGCVDGEEIVTYKIDSELYVESFTRMWNRLSETHKVQEQYAKGNYYIDLDDVEIFDTSSKGFVKCNRIIKNKDKGDWNLVKLSNGRSLLATSDHPLPVKVKGRTFVKDLKVGDAVDIVQSQYSSSNLRIDVDTAWLLGFILCDGCYDNHVWSSIALESENDIEERYKRVFEEVFGNKVKTVIRARGEKGNYKDLVAIGSVGELCNYLETLFGGKQKINRHIPNGIFDSGKETRLAFLAGMLDADGYINSNRKSRPTIQLGSTNKELSLQTMALAQSLGYPAKVYMNHYDSKNKAKIRYRVEFLADAEIIPYITCNKKINNFTNEASHIFNETAQVTSIEFIGELNKYSYDVTTSSDKFDVSGISSHNCRSFLSPWKDEKGKYKFEGRFNQGVVTLNLPQIGIIANGDMETFDKLLDYRLELCFEALMCRHKALEGVESDVAPILWQHGAYGRLKKGEPIDKLLHNGYSTISLGYIGLYEVTKLMTGESHTSPKGTEFALALMNRLNDATKKWKDETGLGFGLYGSPAESLCYRFAKIDKKKYGSIKDITDKEYYTNSYHVDVREEIDAFSKLKFESQFQSISTGGCISYIEANTFGNNLTALKQLVNFIYHNIQYAEFNLKCDYCFKCGYNGQMTITNDLDWICPNCGNTDKSHMEVVRRTCGYLGSNWWNRGKTNEISKRVLHI